MAELITAVTGATGFIGRFLIARLLQENASIQIVTRNPGWIPDEWHGRLSVIGADIARDRVRFRPQTDLVFHCAGEIRNPSNFIQTNVVGTRNILDACIRNNIKKFVYLSSVGVMGIKKTGVFDEKAPCSPRNGYERSKLEAEKIVLETGQKQGLSVAVLRPGIVYGPGKVPKRDSFLSLIRSIKNGYFRYIGSDKGIYNIVYVGEVIEALLHLAFNPTPEKKKIFIINDPMTWGDFVLQVNSILGLKHKVSTIPKVAALCLALGCELGSMFGMKLPFSMTRFKALTFKTIFSSERIKKELDFKFLFGNQKGLKKTIDYYRKKHFL